ncbi:MAG: hypothetical protein KJ767_00200 [Nanoarchaeota archaeon]|nr:hypothetical protein [Nanoarchaeota archaeon]
MVKIYYRDGNKVGEYPKLLDGVRFKKREEKQEEVSLDDVLEGKTQIKESTRTYCGKGKEQLLHELAQTSRLTKSIGKNLKADVAIVDFYDIPLKDIGKQDYKGSANITFYAKS